MNKPYTAYSKLFQIHTGMSFVDWVDAFRVKNQMTWKSVSDYVSRVIEIDLSAEMCLSMYRRMGGKNRTRVVDPSRRVSGLIAEWEKNRGLSFDEVVEKNRDLGAYAVARIIGVSYSTMNVWIRERGLSPVKAKSKDRLVSESMIRDAESMRKEGKSWQVIADLFGVNVNTLRSTAIDMGIHTGSINRGGYCVDKYNWIARHHGFENFDELAKTEFSNGLTRKEIAEKYGMSYNPKAKAWPKLEWKMNSEDRRIAALKNHFKGHKPPKPSANHRWRAFNEKVSPDHRSNS